MHYCTPWGFALLLTPQRKGLGMETAIFDQWIGKRQVRHDTATARLLAEYRATLGPWLFEIAPDIAPPGFHFGLAPATPDLKGTAADGSEAGGGFLPPLPYPHRMWAGGTIESLAGIRLGAAITRNSTVANLSHRHGQSGPLVLVTIDHEVRADGIICVRERQDLVFRGGHTQPAQGRKDDMIPQRSWTVPATPLLLFRFSAFTFNGLRIHYDEAFCRHEGYAGLLVHGPLQAALMLNLISSVNGTIPARFDYRCVAPLVGGPDFTVLAGGDGVVRVVRNDGATTAEGRIHVPDTGSA